MKTRLSVILYYIRKRNIKILNLCKISIHARNVSRKIYNIHFYNNKLLDLKTGPENLTLKENKYISVFEKDNVFTK